VGQVFNLRPIFNRPGRRRAESRTTRNGSSGASERILRFDAQAGILYAPHGAPCQMTLNNGNLVEQTYVLQQPAAADRHPPLDAGGGCPAASGSSASDDLAYLSLQYYNTDSTKTTGTCGSRARYAEA